ncbi:hypothetical protein ABIF61_003751 [Bradyrhizobium japonicum]
MTERPTCAERRSPTAYLRVALTYMLISMPQGTSTIFGAFQAILALHFREFGRIRPPVKLMRAEKFASEIFPRSPCCAAKKSPREHHFWGAALRSAHSVANPVLIKQL